MRTFAMRTLFLAVLGLIAPSALADVVVTHGTDCTAILPGQAERLQWREAGLANPAQQDLWVLCPMEHQSRTGGYWGGALVLARGDTTAIDVQCWAREVVLGTRVWGQTKTAVLPGGVDTVLQWDMKAVVDPATSSFNIACRLPPGTTITTLVSVSTETESNALLEHTMAELYAF